MKGGLTTIQKKPPSLFKGNLFNWESRVRDKFQAVFSIVRGGRSVSRRKVSVIEIKGRRDSRGLRIQQVTGEGSENNNKRGENMAEIASTRSSNLAVRVGVGFSDKKSPNATPIPIEGYFKDGGLETYRRDGSWTP